jgi:hypothetical protein
MVTVQVLVLLHPAPDQPAKVESPATESVKVTDVPEL